MSYVTSDVGCFTSAANSGEEDPAARNSSGSVQLPPVKKKRNLPGTPDPTAEVIALSPTTLTSMNRFVCEICNKGFQRDQNLQLHRRGHNLPWKLRQRTSTEVNKKVYICPESSCVHHNPSRALGDLTGIKKHFSRKHCEKKWKCDKCFKKYAVHSDWKAHRKTCGSREFKCDCGTIFLRRDSFIAHRAFCKAMAEENKLENPLKSIHQEIVPMPFKQMMNSSGAVLSSQHGDSLLSLQASLELCSKSYLQDSMQFGGSMDYAYTSATALLQKASRMGATASNTINSIMMQSSYNVSNTRQDHQSQQQKAIMLQSVPTITDIDMSTFGGSNGDLIATVDFMGVGRSRTSNFLQQQDDKFEMEATNHQRVMQEINSVPFQHNMGNSMWDV